MTDAGNDARFCRDHAFSGNPLFRVTSILAPQKADSLTALHALFDLLQRIGRLTQEEGAARVQLAWWRQECLAGDPARSAHPALRELHRDGTGRLERAAFGRLIEQVELRLEQPVMASADALRNFCEAQGRPLLELEIGLWPDAEQPQEITPGLAARRGLWSLLTDAFLSTDSPDAWWAPLELLAREGVQRSELLVPHRASAAARLFASLVSSDSTPGAKSYDISDGKQWLEHIQLMDLLITRKQQAICGRAPREYARELSRVRVSEFLVAWSLARRFNRRK